LEDDPNVSEAAAPMKGLPPGGGNLEGCGNSAGRVKLYNDLTRKTEILEPQDGGKVTLYVCGITPYDTTHLGHAFTYAVFDVLVRYLDFRGLPVKYAMNVTDVDDDILRKAREVGGNWKEVGNRWAVHFIEDMQTLNIRPPDFFPRASEVIGEILETVEDLLRAGYAYYSGGSVYFHIESWPEYGKLSRLPREEMLPVANERGNYPNDRNKRHPLDFVLWQARQPGEPAWDSPWGWGRPGWHIECSTMATRFLGAPLDIHGGGADLTFPHHESEIAQSEGATGRGPFARFWMHTAMVFHQGEKMSKSLGNLVLVRDLLKRSSPDALRLYMGDRPYGDSWEFREEQMGKAEELARILARAARAKGGPGPFLDPGPKLAAFTQAMDQNLGTVAAVENLKRLAEEILEGERRGRAIGKAQEILRRLGKIFGLRLDQEGPDPGVSEGWKEHRRRFEDTPR
jgi:L-cysteine:1D-myo-inositol 2-amino-2-deoxy-alpha-D-glucopyranoside ligase